MDAVPAVLPAPDRDLTALEEAIQAFNAGADPSAGALQRAFLAAEVAVLSSSEVHPDGNPDGLHLRGIGGGSDNSGDGESYLAVYTHDDRVPQEVGERFRWMVRTSGANVLAFTTQGITINPDSDATLAVAVKAGGVQQLRELARGRQSAADARAARPPHDFETALAAVDPNGMNAEGILRFGADLWPANLFVPSSRPLDGGGAGGGTIDLDVCFTFGDAAQPALAVFTDRDQLGEFAAAHLLEITGGQLVHRLPAGAGIMFNPQRPDQLSLSAQGLQLIATLIEREAPPAEPVQPAPPEQPAKRGLFRRRR